MQTLLLSTTIEADHFRSDLYYRLSVATIKLPPLYERAGDILPLAHHFIATYCEKMKMENVRLSNDAETALLSYEWPGNIRELENVIHYALIVCRDNVIFAEDLKLAGAARRQRPPQEITEIQHRASTVTGAIPLQATQVAELPLSAQVRLQQLILELIEAGEPALFELVEQSLIHSAYNFCYRNQVQTAKILGISRNILRTHLKHHGIIGDDSASTSGKRLVGLSTQVSTVQ